MIHRYIIEATDEVKGFEEAIEKLDREWGIEELEPCNDCISRQAVIKQINCWIGSGEYRYTNATHYLTRRMQELPSVTPQELCDDAVSREEAKQFLYGRIDRLNDDELYDIFSKIIDDMYNELPPVTPQQEPCSNCCNGNQIEKAKLCQKSYLAGMEHKQEPKTGHWITLKDEWGDINEAVCSCCDKNGNHKWHYCPNCGASMIEPQESEVEDSDNLDSMLEDLWNATVEGHRKYREDEE